jgi:hypothetical protein
VPPDDVKFLRTAQEIYAKNSRYSEAMSLAIRLGDRDLILRAFEAPPNMWVSSKARVTAKPIAHATHLLVSPPGR